MIRPVDGLSTMEKIAMMPAVCPASSSPMWYVVISHFGPKAKNV